MATLYTDIYALNNIIQNDSRVANQPSNLIYQTYYKYLLFAIGHFKKKCYKDLTNRIPFSQIEYNYIANGTDNQFQLSSTPPSNSLFFIGVTSDLDTAYTEITGNNYTYDVVSNTITIFGNTLSSGTYVYISIYVIGQFNLDLDEQEQLILAEGMSVPYSQEAALRNSLLTQMVKSGSFDFYSQAQHINAVQDVANNQYFVNFRALMMEYTYENHPTNCSDLGVGKSYGDL